MPEEHIRTCRYGHGELLELQGGYFLQRAYKSPVNGFLAPDDGSGYLVKLALCPVCKYVELFDEDGSSLT